MRAAASAAAKTPTAVALAACTLALALAGCTSEEPPADASGYVWQLPAGFPRPVVPASTPMSAAKVELGRHLFYDLRLSGNGQQACASCHEQARAFSDGRPRGVGSTGAMHARNPQGLGNVAYLSTLTWIGPGLGELERQLEAPMRGDAPIELGMGGHEDGILARLAAEPRYAELFAAAFPGQAPSFDSIKAALASFVRALISGNSAFDRHARGERGAMSPAALRGADLFFSRRLGCTACHGGFQFTTATRYVGSTDTPLESPFHNIGLYNLDGAGAYPADAPGLRAITGQPRDEGRFRVPSLRNVELTAPYMHDGSVATLEDVIKIYEDGGRVLTDGPNAGDGRASPLRSRLLTTFQLDDGERADLLAFLRSLTDPDFVTDPRFANPW